MIPESKLGSAIVSLFLTVPIGMGIIFLAVHLTPNYGWTVFIAFPFILGFGAALIHGIRARRSCGQCVGVACLSIGILGLSLLAFAFEGLSCLIMALPLALPLAALGGICGYLVQRPGRSSSHAPVFLCLALVAVPGMQWMEHLAAPVPDSFVVHSSIDIPASPQEVWKQVIAFSEIPPPTEWLFRAGIAYPIRAEIIGSGPGAERYCVFSTGAFVEPIEVWDEPRLLKFSVTANPPPMEEWTPYHHIDPPHLHGFLVSQKGQFALTPLPNGGTHLEGTTQYRHGLWPSTYWRLWSDMIIHQIHMRVLRHIRDEAMRGPERRRAS